MKFAYTIIFVENIAATVEFYQAAFGIKAQVVNPMFAQMDTGEVKLAFGAYSNERKELPEGFGFYENNVQQDPAGIQISFTTEDVEIQYAHAVAAGAIAVVSPKTMPWGQTVSRVRDLNGVLVSIVSPAKF